MKRIRRTGPDKETINVCYVIDDWPAPHRRPLHPYSAAGGGGRYHRGHHGAELSSASRPWTTRRQTARALGKYDFLALPVVDTENRLVGIVTVDDAIDVLQEEVTEDIEKMAAMLPSDKPYLKTSTFETFKARIPWLLLLMISATFTGQIISSFEDALGACHHPHRLYSHADGHRRQLRLSGQRHGDPRPVSGRDRIFRYLIQVIWKEMPGGAAVRRRSGRRQLRQADAAGPDGIPQSQLPSPVAAVICLTLVCTVLCRQDGGLYAAAAGQKDRL